MKSIKDYPQGAVRTREELESLILGRTEVWEGYGLGRSSFIMKRAFDAGSRQEDECFYYEQNCGIPHRYHKDFNIGQWNRYNNNFLFTTYADAQVYVDACQQDAEQDAAYRAHLQEMDALEEEADRLYPFSEID